MKREENKSRSQLLTINNENKHIHRKDVIHELRNELRRSYCCSFLLNPVIFI